MSYRIETSSNTSSLFNVDAAYVIHLEGNGRLKALKKQLEMHALAPVVHIVFNKGMDDPKKQLPRQTPAHDIVDAYRYVFKECETNGYGNVLILEDDFTFRPDLSKQDAAVVNTFLTKERKNKFVYHLGCIPAFMAPVDLQGNYLIIGSSTHASVYSQALRQQTLRYTGVINDWDWYLTFAAPRYAFTKPLIYQLYPETENSKQWMSLFGLTYFVKIWIRILKLDVQPEPGYSICYMVAKSMFYLGILAGIVFLYALYNLECVLDYAGRGVLFIKQKVTAVLPSQIRSI